MYNRGCSILSTRPSLPPKRNQQEKCTGSIADTARSSTYQPNAPTLTFKTFNWHAHHQQPQILLYFTIQTLIRSPTQSHPNTIDTNPHSITSFRSHMHSQNTTSTTPLRVHLANPAKPNAAFLMLPHPSSCYTFLPQHSTIFSPLLASALTANSPFPEVAPQPVVPRWHCWSSQQAAEGLNGA